jgi:hypothetical protein
VGVLADYRCPGCGAVAHAWVPSPPPSEVDCTVCGLAARRVFSAVGVVGRARQPSTAPPGAGNGSLCRTNQDIPGLCMFTPTAQRALVARVRGDNRALDAELAYQERMQKEVPGTLAVTDHGCSAHEHHGDGHDSHTTTSTTSTTTTTTTTSPSAPAGTPDTG